MCWGSAAGVLLLLTVLPACLAAVLHPHMRRGIAFITFASQQAADSALEYDGEQVEGQTLKVRRPQLHGAAH
jgi:hypothetical protein